MLHSILYPEKQLTPTWALLYQEQYMFDGSVEMDSAKRTSS